MFDFLLFALLFTPLLMNYVLEVEAYLHYQVYFMSELLAGCRCFLEVLNLCGLVKKRARGVILDSSKPFIPNLGCKRKVIVRPSSISLLEVIRVILEFLIAGKLALKTCNACNEYIQQHRCVVVLHFQKA